MSFSHDFAVLGDTPQARLIAGLLASTHKKRVILQGESQSAYRLPRGIDLSVAPLTRPETWAMLQKLGPETRKLIVRLGGRSSIARIDAHFQASGQAAVDALGHIRHMAQAFNFPAERAPAHLAVQGKSGLVFRDALLLHRASLEPALDRWLASVGVQKLDPGGTLSLQPGGSAGIELGDQHWQAQLTILADDAAILAHLPADAWPSAIMPRTSSTLLAEPPRDLSQALLHHLDTGTTLTRHARSAIAAMGFGTVEQVGAATRALLGVGGSLQQMGQSSYGQIASTDGAPTVGPAGGNGPIVLAGLGLTGAFFAPAIARWLAGTASQAENDWFAARLVDRDPMLSAVSEWGAAL